MRWPIEVLLQELGLGDYQMIAEDGIVSHLHVCCLAHLMLTHRSLLGLGAQATKANRQVQLPPMNLRAARRCVSRSPGSRSIDLCEEQSTTRYEQDCASSVWRRENR